MLTTLTMARMKPTTVWVLRGQEVPGLVIYELYLVDILQGLLPKQWNQLTDLSHPGLYASPALLRQFGDHLAGQDKAVVTTTATGGHGDVPAADTIAPCCTSLDIAALEKRLEFLC